MEVTLFRKRLAAGIAIFSFIILVITIIALIIAWNDQAEIESARNTVKFITHTSLIASCVMYVLWIVSAISFIKNRNTSTFDFSWLIIITSVICITIYVLVMIQAANHFIKNPETLIERVFIVYEYLLVGISVICYVIITCLEIGVMLYFIIIIPVIFSISVCFSKDFYYGCREVCGCPINAPYDRLSTISEEEDNNEEELDDIRV